MSFLSMQLELAAQVPVPMPFCPTLINRAWLDIQRSYLWSFLWGDGRVPTPAPVQGGTVLLTPGLSTVVGDADASASWAAVPFSTPLTTLQFRVGQGTIYNIIGYDAVTDPNAAILTLDSRYVDPTAGASAGYQIYGVYFNAPTPDFVWFDTFTDPISGYTISTTLTRQEQMDDDPQRWMSGWPQAVLPYRINQFIPGSQFYGYPMFEMWPAPLNHYTYTYTYFRRGMPFTSPTDTVIPPLGEDVVIAQAKYRAYEWCAANLDKLQPDQRKGDFKFLMGAAQKERQMLQAVYEMTDESFSNRHLIPYADSGARSDLPWVSMASDLMYAP